MEHEWLEVATSAGLWLIGFIFAGNALIQSYLFYRLSRRVGARVGMSKAVMNQAVKASFIASLGPAFGSFVGMTVLVLALGGAYAFAREAAGVGSIMYELIAARAGAEAAGVPLTRDGMTLPALAIIFWVGALGSFGWVLIGGVFTRWLPKIRELMGGGDRRRLQVVSVAIMLAVFGRLLVNDSVAPLLLDGRWPAAIASLVGGGASLIWLRFADSVNRPALKEYCLIVALVLGMTAGQLTRLITH
jgi:Domain of unknown function (DUF5058)